MFGLEGEFQAIILAGGLGTRLRPITETVPKPMVEVNGKPFLEMKIEHLKKYNIRDIVICIGYLGNKIEEYFGDGKNFGVNIRYAYEKELLGTGGAIKNAEPLIKSKKILVMNGDTHIPINLFELFSFHERQHMPITMVVTPATNPKEQELIEAKSNRVINFYRRNTPEHEDYFSKSKNPLINGGVYIFNKEILEEIPSQQKVSMENEIFPRLIEQMACFSYVWYLKDIANEKYLRELEQDIKIGNIKRKVYRARAPVRITFGGGGTDIYPYDKNHGGICISATINKYVYGSLVPRPDKKIIIKSWDFNYMQEFDNSEEIKNNQDINIISAAIKKMDPRSGFELYLRSEIPPHSGLGASATACVVVIGLLNNLRERKERLSKHEIAELAYEIEEVELENVGGRQDQYAATFGGVNLYKFNGENFVLISPTEIDSNYLLELEKNLLVVSTGKRTRSSGDIHKDEKERRLYSSEDKIYNLHKIKETAIEMNHCLKEGKMGKFGALIKDSWEIKKKFNPNVTNNYIDHLVDVALQNGAVGGRLMGAGGGGHLLFYCEPDREYHVAEALQEFGSKPIYFSFDFDGLKVWEILEEY